VYKPLTAGAFCAALITFIVFITCKNNDFVALDDYAYIVNNTHIANPGWNTFIWSFTSVFEGNWHPLTMLSLAFDRYIWGLKPFGFHLTNMIIHCISVYISCFVFWRILRESASDNLSERSVAIGSIGAALFFSLHPLRVESVVWASERKDVLCMLFIITSILMYFRYSDRKKKTPQITCWHFPEYYFVLSLSALALLSKPTAVSLPFILIIIDYYPLKRLKDRTSFTGAITEKIPFGILSIIGVASTLFAQQIAMVNAPKVDVLSRLLVACKALLFYLAASIWPSTLMAFYKHPGNVASYAMAEYLIYAGVFSAICLLVLCFRRKHPALSAFWLFYVITVLPMLGLIQVGGQWVADRYSYLPSLAIAIFWGSLLAYFVDKFQISNKRVLAGSVISLLVSQLILYSVLTLRQIQVWKNTDTLASRIIDYSPNQSGAPYLARAIYRNESGRYQEALSDIGEAMKIALRNGLTRTYPETAFVQAVILKNLARYPEALATLDWGIQACVDGAPSDAVKFRKDLVRLVENQK
jgi:hypothetical protein